MGLTNLEFDKVKVHLAYLDQSLVKRGFQLLKNGDVRFGFYDPDLNTFNFIVRGNVEPDYDVSIDLLKSYINPLFNEYDTDLLTCTCMYYEENLECKHIAAALLYLETFSNTDFKQVAAKEITIDKTQENKNLGFPLVIPCTEEELALLYEKIPGPMAQASQDLSIRDYSFLENGIQYTLHSYYFTGSLIVTFEDNKVTIKGDQKRPNVVKQMLSWLKYRYSGKENSECVLLTANLRNQAIKKELDKLGLFEQLSRPYEAFSFYLDMNGIGLKASGELKGLKKLDQVYKHLESHLSALPDFNKLPDFGYTKDEIGAYNLGFGLFYSDYRGFHEIIPFMAKGTKKEPKAMSVKFQLVEDPNDLRLSKVDDLEKILNNLSKINRAIRKNKEQEIFDLFQQFLSQVEEIPFYTFLGTEYETRTIKKYHFRNPLEVQRAKVKLVLSKIGKLYSLHVYLVFEGREINLQNEVKKISVNQAFLVLDGNYLLVFDHLKVLKLLQFLKSNPIIQSLEDDFETFFQKIVLPLATYLEIDDRTGTLKEAESSSSLQKQLYITEHEGLVVFRPRVKYAENAFSSPLDSGAVIDLETKTVYHRDQELEEKFLEFIKELHPYFEHNEQDGYFFLSHESFMDGLWFMKAFEKLKAEQVRIFGLEHIKIKKYSPFPPSISLEFSSTQDWFEVNAQVAFGDQKVKLKDIKKALDRDQEYIELEDGSIGILPEHWLKKFGKLFRSGEIDKDGVSVPKTLFNVLDEFEETSNFPKIVKELQAKKAKLAGFTQIKNVKVPKQLQAELRNYQITGLNWLNFLQEYGWGGILADDMGLGKTLQMIALICKIIEENPKAKILVVAPTTLLFNWKAELEKFAPHVDYFIHHGSRYETKEELLKHQVILTSYGLVTNDLVLLQEIEFDAIIADESQAIKNTQSQRYRSIVKLKGKIKLAMTGTPIENSLAELFAQMNFVNPGFFQSFNSFKQNYLLQLKRGNQEILQELQQKIKPFVLRRTKEEVLTELPEKTEEYLYCIMPPTQRKIYDAYRNEYRDYLLKKIEEEGIQNSKMYVLEGLTKLRLACDASQLVNHTEAKNESAKIDLLMEHILEKTGNHKVLIFSQFVKMLELIKERLEENLIDFSYLDGSTNLKEREKVVNAFQQDTRKRVFLISLKAGGTGLNLTAADYVYIVDPWWNPAVENQAIDRCYRMGQEKHVVAYRMICKDTIEEKIILLQQAKSKIAKEVISEGDSFLGSLDKESLMGLFE